MKKIVTSLIVSSMLLKQKTIMIVVIKLGQVDIDIGCRLRGWQFRRNWKKLNVKYDYEKIEVSVNDVSDYLSSSSNLSYIFKCDYREKSFGNGVDVTIDTPDNITKVTTERYRNAALTTSIQKAGIHIVSVENVTCEGALAG